MSKLEIKEMHWLKKQVWSCFRFYFTCIFLYMQILHNAANRPYQVPLYNEKVAVLESTVHKLEEEILDLVSLSPGNEFLAQSASLGSHDTHNMDRSIMKISPEETSGNSNIPNNSSVQSKNKKGLTEHMVLYNYFCIDILEPIDGTITVDILKQTKIPGEILQWWLLC